MLPAVRSYHQRQLMPDSDFSDAIVNAFRQAQEFIRRGHAANRFIAGEPEQPALDTEDVDILRALHKHPNLLKTRRQIESLARVSEKTIGLRMPELMRWGLVHQPRGKKSGYAITRAGIE